MPDAAGLEGPYSDIVRDELNLKSVDLQDAGEVSAADYGISQSLAVNARAAGPRLGKQVQAVIKAAKSGDWSVAEDGTVVAGGIELAEGEYSLQTTVGAPAGADGAPDGGGAADERAVAVVPGGFLVLDTSVSAELAAEGTARDVVRAVQSARKDAGLEVSDRVRTVITGPAAVLQAVDAHRDLVSGETLTVEPGWENAVEGALGQLIEGVLVDAPEALVEALSGFGEGRVALGQFVSEARERAARGAEFDRAFMQYMVADHEKAVAKFDEASRTATDADVKAFAASTLPVLQEHLRMAKEIQTKLR